MTEDISLHTGSVHETAEADLAILEINKYMPQSASVIQITPANATRRYLHRTLISLPCRNQAVRQSTVQTPLLTSVSIIGGVKIQKVVNGSMQESIPGQPYIAYRLDS